MKRNLLGALASVLILSAQPDRSSELAGLDLNALAKVAVVSGARHEQDRAESPRSISVITREEIRRRNYRNIPEALAELAGVFVQQTNYAGGSPYIRGMIGNRVLILVDGVRLNNSSYRFGPNQYLNYIDIRRVERIEVVRGNGSVLYGSDAMGGAIHIITRQAPEPAGGAEVHGSVAARFATGDDSGQGRAEVSGTWKNTGFQAGFTREAFDDFAAPGRGGRIQSTGYRQQSFDTASRIRLGENRTLRVSAQQLFQNDVVRDDTIRAGQDLLYCWPEQGRQSMQIQYEQTALHRFADSLTLTFAVQRQSEDLHRIPVSNPTVRTETSDNVATANYGVQMSSSAGTKHFFTYGAEGYTDRIGSTRIDRPLTPGRAAWTQRGNFADGSGFHNFGAFLQHEWTLSNRLAAALGVRADHFHTMAEIQDPALGLVAVDHELGAVTGSAFLIAKLNSRFDWTGGVSRGFRSPSIDDSTTLRLSGGRQDVPNPFLRPEKSNNFESSIRYHTGSVRASIAYFYSRYRDLIERSPGLYMNKPYIDLNGDGRQNAGEPMVFTRNNVGRARVHGAEAEVTIRVNDQWSLAGTVNWTHADDLAQRTPLTRTPPLNGMARASWAPKRGVWLECVLIAADEQHRLSANDIADVRIGRAGSPGWAAPFFRFGLDRSALAGLTVTFDNWTNRRYHTHGSGVARPGRAITIAMQKWF